MVVAGHSTPRHGNNLIYLNPQLRAAGSWAVGNHSPRNPTDPPPMKGADLRYELDIEEDCNGKEALQA